MNSSVFKVAPALRFSCCKVDFILYVEHSTRTSTPRDFGKLRESGKLLRQAASCRFSWLSMTRLDTRCYHLFCLLLFFCQFMLFECGYIKIRLIPQCCSLLFWALSCLQLFTVAYREGLKHIAFMCKRQRQFDWRVLSTDVLSVVAHSWAKCSPAHSEGRRLETSTASICWQSRCLLSSRCCRYRQYI